MHLHSSLALGLVLALSSASPLSSQLAGGSLEVERPLQLSEALERRSTLDNDTQSACNAAPNCEVFHDAIFGDIPRFVAGKGPGSEWYAANVEAVDDEADDDNGENIQARADDKQKAKKKKKRNTNVDVSGEIINYGTARASGTSGAIHHLYDLCHKGSCETKALTLPTTWAGNTNEWGGTLTLYANGNYNGWKQRDVFVEAVLAVAAAGENCWEQKWMHGGVREGITSGSAYMCKQTNFISINRFVNGAFHGNLQVRVERKADDAAMCGKITGALGDLTGLLGAVPGLSALKAGKAFFGIVALTCK